MKDSCTQFYGCLVGGDGDLKRFPPPRYDKLTKLAASSRVGAGSVAYQSSESSSSAIVGLHSALTSLDEAQR